MNAMLPSVKAGAVAHLRAALAFAESMPVITPCASCIEFSQGYCSQWKAPVPKEAQAAGCPSFSEMPF